MMKKYQELKKQAIFTEQKSFQEKVQFEQVIHSIDMNERLIELYFDELFYTLGEDTLEDIFYGCVNDQMTYRQIQLLTEEQKFELKENILTELYDYEVPYTTAMCKKIFNRDPYVIAKKDRLQMLFEDIPVDQMVMIEEDDFMEIIRDYHTCFSFITDRLFHSLTPAHYIELIKQVCRIAKKQEALTGTNYDHQLLALLDEDRINSYFPVYEDSNLLIKKNLKTWYQTEFSARHLDFSCKNYQDFFYLFDTQGIKEVCQSILRKQKEQLKELETIVFTVDNVNEIEVEEKYYQLEHTLKDMHTMETVLNMYA